MLKKKPYNKPELVKYEKLREITLASRNKQGAQACSVCKNED